MALFVDFTFQNPEILHFFNAIEMIIKSFSSMIDEKKKKKV